MEVGGLIGIVKELGLSIGVFGLCVWIVVYIVKNLTKNLESLISRLDVFMQAVKREHLQHDEQHKALMKEHNEMIKVLGRINGYKEH